MAREIYIVHANDIEQKMTQRCEQLAMLLRVEHDMNVAPPPTVSDVVFEDERHMEFLRHADIILVMVSASLFKCEWCMEGIEHFLDRNNHGEPVNIIPVPLEPVAEIYFEIRSQTISGESDARQARVAYALEKIETFGFSARFSERDFAQRENYLADMIARSIKEIERSYEFDNIFLHTAKTSSSYYRVPDSDSQVLYELQDRSARQDDPSGHIGLLSDDQLTEQRQLIGSMKTDTLSKDYPKAELVDFSAFSPPTVQPDQWFSVQVYLHLEKQFGEAEQLAVFADPDTQLRNTETLLCPVERGSKLDILIVCDDLDIPEQAKKLVWRGRSTSCTFLACIPEEQLDKTFHPKILIIRRGQPLGEIVFSIRADQTSNNEIAIVGDNANRFERIFMSYARKDMNYVRQIARTFISLDRDFFWDMLHIGPKERWERQLYKEIDKADLFYLFWSCSARDSKWVRKETEYALERAEKTGRPEIICYPLEGPPRPAPLWEIIRDQQCGDMIYNMMAKARPRRNWLGRLFRNGRNG